MCGKDRKPDGMFSYLGLEEQGLRAPPLQPIRALVDATLTELSSEFERLYATVCRPLVSPERRLRTRLLQACNTTRSKRLLMGQFCYNLRFRSFVGLSIDDRVWGATGFCKNWDRLLADEHFGIDGTLIKTWASLKSFVPLAAG